MIEQTATRLRVIQTAPRPSARLFAVLADPARHTEIDGSGMLRASPTALQQTVRSLVEVA